MAAPIFDPLISVFISGLFKAVNRSCPLFRIVIERFGGVRFFIWIVGIRWFMASRFAWRQRLAVRFSLMAVMTALVAVATFVVRVPNGLGGYFNFGDIAIFVVALTFDPVIAGFAGGVGSAISDAIGFPVFVIPTLIIKGLEGLLAGMISNRKQFSRDVLAIVVAGTEMIVGYFIAEYFFLPSGQALAAVDLPVNIIQIAVGGVVGVPVGYFVRRSLPPMFR